MLTGRLRGPDGIASSSSSAALDCETRVATIEGQHQDVDDDDNNDDDDVNDFDDDDDNNKNNGDDGDRRRRGLPTSTITTLAQTRAKLPHRVEAQDN